MTPLLKKIFLLSNVSFLFVCSSPHPIQKLNPSTTLIAWDLHGVVLKHQPLKMAFALVETVWHSDVSWSLLAMAANPVVWYTVYTLKKANPVTEEFIEGLITTYPLLQPYKSYLLQAIMNYTLDQEVVETILHLKTCGYRNIVASNITLHSWNLMVSHYPLLHDLFDGVYTAYTRNEHDVLYSKNPKPSCDYFYGLAYFLKDKNVAYTNILFIDDQEKNTQAAQKALGIPTLVYYSTHYLRNDLNKITTCYF